MKTLFTFTVDNVIDIITNSSSELFVLEEQTLEIAKEMIANKYPDYLSEYNEIVCLRDAEPSAISTYESWVEGPWHSNYDYRSTPEDRKKNKIRAAERKAEKYGMAKTKFYTNWEDRNNDGYWYPNISAEGYRKIAKKLDPDGKIFLLFSIDENPNWEMQEELECVATRYHLG